MRTKGIAGKAVAITIAVLVLSSISLIAYADVIFYDSFDNEPADSGVPNNWQLEADTPGSIINVTTIRSVNGSQSHFSDTDGSGNIHITNSSFGTTTGNISYSIYQEPGGNDAQFRIYESNGSRARVITVGMKGGDLKYYDGSWNTISTTPDAGQWVNITIYDINASSDTYSVEWSTNKNSGEMTNISSENSISNGIDELLMYTSGGYGFYDNILVQTQPTSTPTPTPTPTATATATATESNPNPVVSGQRPIDCGLFCNPIFGSETFFLVLMITVGGVIGLMSKRLAIAGFAAYILFVSIAVTVDISFFTELLYLIVIIFIIAMGLKVYQFFISSGREM